MNLPGNRHFILSIVLPFGIIYRIRSIPPGIYQAKQREVSGMEDEFADLVQAVVMQAMEDFHRARSILRRRPDSTRARRMLRDVEGFFRSVWFNTLTGLDGREILEKLKGDDI